MDINLESCSQLLELKNILIINLIIDNILAQPSLSDKNDQILKLILEKKSLEHPMMEKIASWAIEKNKIHYIKMILDSPNMDPCVDNYKLIYQSIDKRCSEIAIILLNDSRVVAKQHMIPNILFNAVNKQMIEVVKLLLKNPLSNPINGQTISRAYYDNYYDILKLLIFDPITDLNYLNNTLLPVSIGHGDLTTFAMLMEHPEIHLNGELINEILNKKGSSMIPMILPKIVSDDKFIPDDKFIVYLIDNKQIKLITQFLPKIILNDELINRLLDTMNLELIRLLFQNIVLNDVLMNRILNTMNLELIDIFLPRISSDIIQNHKIGKILNNICSSLEMCKSGSSEESESPNKSVSLNDTMTQIVKLMNEHNIVKVKNENGIKCTIKIDSQ